MLNINVIPKGDYCYTIDRIEYNDNCNIPPSIKIDLCPYWKYMDVRTQEPYCSYCDMNGIPYSNALIGDQCKVCGIKDDEWLESE
jgi:hypothetical protein